LSYKKSCKIILISYYLYIISTQKEDPGEEKYLKYKEKYLDLPHLIGGSNTSIVNLDKFKAENILPDITDDYSKLEKGKIIVPPKLKCFVDFYLQNL
jgi:hypothetical protein